MVSPGGGRVVFGAAQDPSEALSMALLGNSEVSKRRIQNRDSAMASRMPKKRRSLLPTSCSSVALQVSQGGTSQETHKPLLGAMKPEVLSLAVASPRRHGCPWKLQNHGLREPLANLVHWKFPWRLPAKTSRMTLNIRTCLYQYI